MQKAAHLSKPLALIVALALGFQPVTFAAAEEVKKHETGLYRDVFLQNLYYEGTNWLHLERLYRAATRKKSPALDVNAYDEVPDSLFFTNRHARKPLTAEELAKGPSVDAGPDLTRPYTVVKGKFDGLHPGFFIRDEKGVEYLLKFDSDEGPELATGAEVVASRFLHALGYNVPQYTIASLAADQATIDTTATAYDDTGFKKPLTRERFDKYIMFIPQDDQGHYRASAGRMLDGENKGFMPFQGRRKADSNDTIDHERRRSLRALRVFASWLNIYDIRESNTLDMLVDENGQKVIRHYLIDFNDALGAAAGGAKPPMFTYEHMIDYGQEGKAFVTLGLWEKPWQKKWDKLSKLDPAAPAVGYFDAQDWKPSSYKVQLPHYAFKDLTRADGFWAAKQLRAFSDEDIRAIVKMGAYTNAEDADRIAAILIERRDQIINYWFSQSNPLDNFDLEGNQLTYQDLSGTADASQTVIVSSVQGKKKKVLATVESKNQSLDISSWTSGDVELVFRSGSQKKLPAVTVRLQGGKLISVRHQD